MCAAKKRIELFIEVFDLPAQRAHALIDLTPTELVNAILQEFREIDYLDTDPTKYQLVKTDDRTPLKDTDTIEAQIREGDHLHLEEIRLSTPPGARQAAADLYLREMATGRVFRLHWLPAIIGRDDPHQPNNQLVAANLAPFKTGLRVSRRHARIIEENGRYFIVPLSGNPTSLRSADQRQQLILSQPHPLMSGDVIVLDRSEIQLKFIVRMPQSTAHEEGQPSTDLGDAQVVASVGGNDK